MKTYTNPVYAYERSPDQDGPPPRRPVIVIGAGPVGLAAAIDLAQRDVVTFRCHADHLVLPAQLRLREVGQPLDQDLLGPVLLEIDEGRPMMTGFGQQVELEHLFVAEEHPPDVPAHALLHQTLAASQAIEYFERALGPADGA